MLWTFRYIMRDRWIKLVSMIDNFRILLHLPCARIYGLLLVLGIRFLGRTLVICWSLSLCGIFWIVISFILLGLALPTSIVTLTQGNHRSIFSTHCSQAVELVGHSVKNDFLVDYVVKLHRIFNKIIYFWQGFDEPMEFDLNRGKIMKCCKVKGLNRI